MEAPTSSKSTKIRRKSVRSKSLSSNFKLGSKSKGKVVKFEEKVDRTLDLMAQDLVSKGHMSSGKTYLLKSPEMREHVGKLHRQISKRKKLKSSRTSKAPIDTAEAQVNPEKSTPKAARSKKIAFKPLPSSKPKLKKAISGKSKKPTSLKSLKAPKSASSGNTDPSMMVLSKPKKIKKSLKSVTSSSPRVQQQFYFPLDLSGFKDDEISLELKGRELKITANKSTKSSQRFLQETVSIPRNVSLNRVQMERHANGVLVIQERDPEDAPSHTEMKAEGPKSRNSKLRTQVDN